LGENVFEIFAAIWERLTKEIVQSSPLDLLVKVVAALILATLVYFSQKLARKFLAWIMKIFPRWWDCCRRLARAQEAVKDRGPGLWLTIKPEPPTAVSKLPNLGKLILTVANLKGGVGKTTLTANLAAYFANPSNDPNRQSRRVLVVDLDFQGSCSSLLFAGTPWQPNEEQLSQASQLISGSLTLQGQVGQHVNRVNRARGISAFYDLARVENSEMVRWLIGDETSDIRYRLADVLLSDAVLNNFDIVLIDAPPRLTTASIQALCASTHVLIPTILDTLSADAVGYFGSQLKAHEALWPHLKVMGIVGTLTNRAQRTEEEPILRLAGDRLRAALEGTTGRLRHLESNNTRFEFPYECSIRRSTPIARAANQGVPYVSIGNNNAGRAVRAMFNNFGKEVERRWPL
jgi:cellulose biosynthesis protein BcsQ